MTLTEKYYYAENIKADSYQWIKVVQEPEGSREFVRFELMQERWRSKEEAAAYLRWAADQLETLP